MSEAPEDLDALSEFEPAITREQMLAIEAKFQEDSGIKSQDASGGAHAIGRGTDARRRRRARRDV
jgi:hypothetical protein